MIRSARTSIALAIALAAASTVIAGCGSSSDAAGTTTTTATSAGASVPPGAVSAIRPTDARRLASVGPPGKVVDIRSKADLTEFLEGVKGRPAVVVVYAPWCGPCVTFNQRLMRLLNTREPDWRPPGQPDQLTTRTAYVSIDDVDMPVEAVPTALRYVDSGLTDQRMVGAQPSYAQFVDTITPLYQ